MLGTKETWKHDLQTLEVGTTALSQIIRNKYPVTQRHISKELIPRKPILNAVITSVFFSLPSLYGKIQR
jgi:hypothetical protein